MTENGPRVFLSYARDEMPYVRAVVDELRRRGVDAWVDSEIVAGSEWQETIKHNLRAASVVVVFISAAALRSPSINFEIGAAVGGDKKVVAVFLTEAARRDAPALLSAVQGIDAHDLKPKEVAAQIADAVA